MYRFLCCLVCCSKWICHRHSLCCFVCAIITSFAHLFLVLYVLVRKWTISDCILERNKLTHTGSTLVPVICKCQCHVRDICTVCSGYMTDGLVCQFQVGFGVKQENGLP